MSMRPPLMPSYDRGQEKRPNRLTAVQWLVLSILSVVAIALLVRFLIPRDGQLSEIQYALFAAALPTAYLGLRIAKLVVSSSRTYRDGPVWWKRGGLGGLAIPRAKRTFGRIVHSMYPNAIPVRAYRIVLNLSGDPLPLGPDVYLGHGESQLAKAEGRELVDLFLSTNDEEGQLRLYGRFGDGEPQPFTPENFPELDWPRS